MKRGLNRPDSGGTLAFVIAASCSSPSPELDTIPQQFIISVTRFRKRFIIFHSFSFYVELSRLIVEYVVTWNFRHNFFFKKKKTFMFVKLVTQVIIGDIFLYYVDEFYSY